MPAFRCQLLHDKISQIITGICVLEGSHHSQIWLNTAAHMSEIGRASFAQNARQWLPTFTVSLWDTTRLQLCALPPNEFIWLSGTMLAWIKPLDGVWPVQCEQHWEERSRQLTTSPDLGIIAVPSPSLLVVKDSCYQLAGICSWWKTALLARYTHAPVRAALGTACEICAYECIEAWH